MAKEFKDWVDEFVKNGANPKNIPHWPEEVGGTKVVNELPQVGEEHTIYELQEISKPSYGWMFTTPTMSNQTKIQLVFDTYEQMSITMSEIKVIEGNTYPDCCLAYLRNTNQLYMLNPVFTDQPHWEFTEAQKQEDESGTDYAFEVKYTENRGSLVIQCTYTYYILKEFVGNERPVVDGGFEYSGITLDNKEVYVDSGKLFGVLSNIVYPRWVMLFTNFVGYLGAFTYDKLPNSVELETNCYNLLRFFGTYGLDALPFGIYNTTNKAYYLLNPKTTSYQWYNNLEDRNNCYFAQSGDYEGEPPHYTGELEWMYEGSFDDIPDKSILFNEIPYNDIVNHNPPFDNEPVCAFRPKKGGEITSTYWIYANNEWINVDETLKFETQEKTVSPSTNIQEITPDEGYDGLSKVIVEAVGTLNLQEKIVNPTTIEQEITPDDGYDGLSKVTVNAIRLQNKTVSPTTSTQFIIRDAGFDGLRQVTVNPIELQSKTVIPTTSKQYVNPDTNFTGLRQVEVSAVTSAIDSNIKSENIKKDVAILGVTGTYDAIVGATYTCGYISTQLPRTLFNMGVAAVGSNIYIFGGKQKEYNIYDYIYKFNTDTETISTLSTILPKAIHSMGVAQVGDNIYLFGGYSGSGDEKTIYKFNIEAETISTLSVTLPQKLYSMNIATVGGNVYLFGGYTDASNGSGVNAFYKFNTKTETITTLSTTLPQTLHSMSAATVGSNVYIFGGYNSNDRVRVNTIYKFDTNTETVTTLSATLPYELSSTVAATVGSNVYLFGGNNASNAYGNVDLICKFNTETETITKLSTRLTENISSLRAAAVGSKVYLFGGDSTYATNATVKTTIEKFSVNF